MGVISAGNNNSFKSSEYIYGEVRRFLKSFDAANLIDEGEFPTYTKQVLKSLKSGAYKESQALIPIKGKKGSLPKDFEWLYVAYKCTPMNQDVKTPKKHLQGTGFAFVTEVDSAIIENYDNCEITCCESQSKVVNRIQVQQYVIEEKSDFLQFGSIKPLQPSPNVLRDFCIGDCHNMLNKSMYEFTIDNGQIYTNFDDDFVYIKYYAFPIDDEGNILIPNVEEIEQTIKWYIIYQILLSNWFNGSIPDIQNKWQKAEQMYNDAFASAKYNGKLTTFADTINWIRMRRGSNKLVYLTSQISNTNFQRTN